MRKIRLLFFFLFPLLVLTQEIDAQSFCATDEVHRHLLLNNSDYKKAIELQNAKWQQYSKEKAARANRQSETLIDIYEIPVVIHVIHTGQDLGSVYNPSDATLYALIEELNQKYAATWPSFPGIGNGGVNVPIRFKLAQRTPGCQAFNGINRINGSSLPGYSEYGVDYGGIGFGASDIALKALSIWPNTSYLNVWIVTNIQGTTPGGQGVGGYSSFPGSSPSDDGIVLRADQTNWSLTHETGHYFGLWHTFSGSDDEVTCPPNNNCNTDGDQVCDTDPHALVFGCPTGTNPCTGVSYEPVVYNTMNYTFCRNRFTAGQADRMVFMLENFRGSLLTSLGDLPPGTEPLVLASPVAACVPTGIIYNDPNYFGTTIVHLADLRAFNDGHTRFSDRSYTDHTTVNNCLQSQPVAHLKSGENYTISVFTANEENVRGWIDFNNDGIFQPAELIIASAETGYNKTHTASFTVPANGTATCTSLRMRISADFFGQPQPCGVDLQTGQTHDFIVIVQNPASSEPSVSIESNTGTMVCQDKSVTFTATAVNGGNNPSYQWKLNGNNVGANSNTYSTSTLANGDVISCVMTSSAQNICTPTATSNSITISVVAPVTPTISISVSQNNICAGTSVTFIATETNGAIPNFQWKLNGNNVGNNRSTYSTSTLAHGDVVSCVMTSAYPCVTTPTITSNSITMTVIPAVTPSISISVSQNIICAGTNVTFIANPVEGAEPTLRWMLNGNEVRIGSQTYSSSTLADGDVVSCEMTSGYPCAIPKTVTSNSITMTVSPAVTPSISISVSQNIICAGTSVTFIANPVEGAEPTLRWKINGNEVRIGSQTYSSSTLADGDVVSCEMTSGYPCAIPKTVTSNSITMTVSPAVTPSISISVSQNIICAGTNVTFIANPVEGAEPTLRWKINGNEVRIGSQTYSSSTLADGDVVSCEMTSGYPCAIPKTVTSNSIIMTVNSVAMPSVSISASQTNICTGTRVTFTATAINGGTNPRYQWKIGNTIVGTNNPSYATTNLTNGAVVTCVLTSNSPCANTTAVSSQGITMSVSSPPVASIAAAGPTIFCAGKNVLLKTTVGAGYTYQWKKAGVNIDSAALSTYTAKATGGYSVVVTNAGGCSTTTAAKNVTVNPLPLATVIAGGPLTFCSNKSVLLKAITGTGYTYQWKKNAVKLNGQTSSNFTATETGIYSVEIANASGCSATSLSFNVVVNPLPIATIIPNGPLTFCSGKNVILRANTGAGYTYQWKRGGAIIQDATSFTYTATTTGYYTVIVTTAAGCSKTSEVTTVVVNTLPVASITEGGPLTFCTGKNVPLRANTGTGYTYQWKKAGAIITGETSSTYTAKTTGIYTVVVTNAFGCSMTSTGKTVTVNNAPLATVAVAGPTTFCAGKSVLLKAITGAGYTYQWKKSGVNILGATLSNHLANATGVYTVVVTNAAGCSATSDEITVTVNAAPIATITHDSPLTFPHGGNVVLKASTGSGYTYQWKRDGVNLPGFTSETYNATTSGSFTVVVTNTNTCQATSQPVQVSVTPGRPITKGISDDEDLIKVYPNPIYRNEYLNIEWSITAADKGVFVTVSDIAGRKIHSQLLKSYDKTVRITGASGVYIVEFRWGVNKRKIYRVIKIE